MDNQTTMLAIAAIAMAYAATSFIIYQKIGNPKRIKEIQAESSRLSKEMGEAMKSKDDKRIDAINKEYEKFFPKMGEMMMLQFKPMLLILPIYIILTPIVKSTFDGFTIVLPVYLPIFIQNLDKFPNWRNLFGPIGWFWLCVIFGGLAISIIKSQWDSFNAKKKGDGSRPDAPKDDKTKEIAATPAPEMTTKTAPATEKDSVAATTKKTAEITN